MALTDKKFLDYGGTTHLWEKIKAEFAKLDTANDVPIATVDNGVVTLKAGIKEVDGIIASGSGSDITLAKVATTGAASDITVADSGSHFDGSTVEAVLAEIAGDIDGRTVYMTDNTSTSDTDFATIYKIYQGSGNAAAPVAGELIGTINIPKDQFVESAGLVNITFNSNKLYDGSTDVTTLIKGAETPVAADAGKYIKLIFVVTTGTAAKNTIYISVKDLVDVYTGGSNDEITVSVSNSNVITATIGKISASKVDYTTGANGETVAAALTRLDGNDSTTGSVSKKIKDAIGGLDAIADSTKNTIDGSTARTAVNGGVFALQAITETDGKIASMTAVEVDAAGAANAVYTSIIALTNAEIDAAIAAASSGT